MRRFSEYINTIIHADCIDIMRELPDKCIDLVLTDPPYGISVNMNAGKKRGEQDRYDNLKWDKNAPDEHYFDEIKRVSKNQIIWGCNYFSKLLWSAGRISWFKDNGADNDYSDCELAMHTFNTRVTNIAIQWSGYIKPASERGTTRIHPTQKPIDLFTWCLSKYSKENDLILDPFSGSGTTAIACHRMNRRFICIEKEEKYVKLSRERLKIEKMQQRLPL